jgi:hypothetical protein
MVRAMTAKFYWELAKASGRMEWRASIICGQAKCRVASLRAGAGVNPASAGRPIEGSIVKTSSSDPRDCHPSRQRSGGVYRIQEGKIYGRKSQGLEMTGT